MDGPAPPAAPRRGGDRSLEQALKLGDARVGPGQVLDATGSEVEAEVVSGVHRQNPPQSVAVVGDPVPDGELSRWSGHHHRPVERTALKDAFGCGGSVGHPASVPRRGRFAPPSERRAPETAERTRSQDPRPQAWGQSLRTRWSPTTSTPTSTSGIPLMSPEKAAPAPGARCSWWPAQVGRRTGTAGREHLPGSARTPTCPGADAAFRGPPAGGAGLTVEGRDHADTPHPVRAGPALTALPVQLGVAVGAPSRWLLAQAAQSPRPAPRSTRRGARRATPERARCGRVALRLGAGPAGHPEQGSRSGPART
jgi:hypothetical protein